MRLLFVDDECDSIEPAKMEIEDKFEEVHILVESSFEDALLRLASFGPDIVVLDLLRQTATGELAADGLRPLEKMWNERFVTTIVYSAESSRVKESFPSIADHPLVELVDKGSGSEEKVVEAIRRLEPFVGVLADSRSIVESQLSIVLKHVVPQILKLSTVDEDQKIDAIGRVSSRRLAAVADHALDDGRASWAWERYLVPPVSASLVLGDILIRSGASMDSIDDYRIVLSPTCDLVASNERRPKVESVLVAKCRSTSEALGTLAIRRRSEDVRRRILSQGFFERMLPLPALADIIPHMMADLTDLELIRLDKIGDATSCEYKRVASVSNPFRELVGWAYIQTAGRPGLPETNLESWADEVVADARMRDEFE